MTSETFLDLANLMVMALAAYGLAALGIDVLQWMIRTVVGEAMSQIRKADCNTSVNSKA